MSALSILSKILVYSALANQAVKSVEAEIPTAPSATKHETAVAAILAAAHFGEKLPADVVPQEVPIVSAIVDMSVSLLNIAGVFKHKDTQAAQSTSTILD